MSDITTTPFDDPESEEPTGMTAPEDEPADEDEDGDDEQTPAPKGRGGKARPKAKTKPGFKPGPGRKSVLTEEFWAELKALYESASYSQRDLVNYAKGRGIVISQAAISRRAVDDGWVKGHKAAEIRAQVLDEVKGSLGEHLRKMLDRHHQQAMSLEMEHIQHLRVAEQNRRSDPNYVIPAALLRQLTASFAQAQELSARSLGWDYRSGKPFKSDDADGTENLESFDINIMTAEQAAAHQDSLDKDDDGAESEE